MIVLRGVRRDLRAEQAVDRDVADAMEGDEQHAADQHQGVQDARPVGRPAQKVVQLVRARG